MKNRGIAIITTILILVSISCSKYEDGPFITFRSKKFRLEGTWKYQAIIYKDNGVTVTDNLPTLKMTFLKNGTYSENTGYAGTWKFSGTTNLVINKSKDTSNIEISWEIIRLANKQLWLRKDKVEHHFVPN
jgi:hypothetical protein